MQPVFEKGYPSYDAVNRGIDTMTMTDKQIELCTNAAFVRIVIDDDLYEGGTEHTQWVRVDGFDPEEKVLYVHEEDSGEEYSLEGPDLIDAKFYELKEIN
tara:strand:+ start:222 stop:521 length:300 start_codon:yes stop_codon:yes gene_type:complete